MEQATAGHERTAQLPDSFYRDLAHATPPLLAVYADDFGVLFANERFEKEFGCTLSQLRSSEVSLMDMAEPSCRERFMQEMQQFGQTGGLNSFNARFNKMNGSSSCFSVTVNPLKQESGRDCYTLMFLPEPGTDLCPPYISFDSKTALVSRVNEVGFGSFEWYVATDKLYWSDSMYIIAGLDKANPVMSLEKADRFTHPEDREKIAILLKSVLEGLDCYELESRLVTPAGRVKFLHTKGMLMRNPDGSPYKLIGSVKDVTAHKKIEEDLKKHVRELNDSNKELEQFAYIASHDLQEPLRKVSAFGGILAEKYRDLFDEDGKSYLDRMIRASDNMKIMINNLLEYSRITQGVPGLLPIDLGYVLQEVKADLSLLVEETNADISYGAMPELEGDMVQLKQLFSNLINNAIKFRKKEGRAQIWINAVQLSPEEVMNRHLDQDQTYYGIRVEDNGIGFEQEYAAKIFKLFHRLHGKSAYPGSGLGLAICQRIVDNHKGIIYAHSTLGAGASFTIILPQRQE